MWVFTGGAILVLLSSILQGTKRSWHQLLIGCVFGGLGSWVASEIWKSSPYVFVICGVAAVVTENLLIGVVNASKEFASEPVKTFSHFWKLMAPNFGKKAGETEE